MKTISTLLVALIAMSASVFAETKNRMAVDSQGVAIQGYDPVAYFKQNKPVKGLPSNQSVYQGAKFYFASAADKKEVDKNPSKYAPAYGGFCVKTLRKGKVVNGDPNVFCDHKGKRHLCSEKEGADECKEQLH